MRPWRVAAGAVVAVLGVLVILLAVDLRRWGDQMRADDLGFRVSEQAEPTWTAQTILPSRLSRAVLGVDDDRAVRRGIAAFRRAYHTRPGFENGGQRQRLRAVAATALAEVRGSPEQQSQIADLLGVLSFAGAEGSGANSAQAIDAALTAFQNAVRLDPRNESAQYNLELLLRSLVAHGVRVGPNSAPGPRAKGRKGAGAGQPGTGY